MPNFLMRYLLFISIIFLVIVLANDYPTWHQSSWWALVLLISMLAGLYWLPKRGYQAFSSQLLPLLDAIDHYLSALMQCKNVTIEDSKTLNQKKEMISNILQSTIHYPEWVFDFGFNPGLRAGYRFFLIKLEWLVEVLFSLHHLLEQVQPISLFTTVQASFSQVISGNKELLTLIMAGLARASFQTTDTDDAGDIKALEAVIHALLPSHLQLLSISPTEEWLATVGRYMKDFRQILLELVSAIPHRDGQSI